MANPYYNLKDCLLSYTYVGMYTISKVSDHSWYQYRIEMADKLYFSQHFFYNINVELF